MVESSSRDTWQHHYPFYGSTPCNSFPSPSRSSLSSSRLWGTNNAEQSFLDSASSNLLRIAGHQVRTFFSQINITGSMLRTNLHTILHSQQSDMTARTQYCGVKITIFDYFLSLIILNTRGSHTWTCRLYQSLSSLICGDGSQMNMELSWILSTK